MTSLVTRRLIATNFIAQYGHKLCMINTNLAHQQMRFAGHAKWQNIAKTKLAGDMQKGQITSRYVMMVKRAIISGGMQADPRLNSKLGDVLSEASKLNIPRATLERAIQRTLNLKVLQVTLEIQGPAGSTLIARGETENVSGLRRDVKKIVKKFDAALVADNTLMNMFGSKGFIRATTTTKDGRDVSDDFAEEAAIIANAQEVYSEEYEDATDPDMKKMWVFVTDGQTLDPCRGELEKLNLNVKSSDLELVPYREIDFGKDAFEKALELISALKEMEQIIDVFHNLAPPNDGK